MMLQRYKNNPILKPDDFKDRDIGAVFNCGVTTTENGGMLFRAALATAKVDDILDFLKGFR